MGPGVTIVVADMTATTFCDDTSVRFLVLAQEFAAGNGTKLRLLEDDNRHHARTNAPVPET